MGRLGDDFTQVIGIRQFFLVVPEPETVVYGSQVYIEFDRIERTVLVIGDV